MITFERAMKFAHDMRLDAGKIQRTHDERIADGYELVKVMTYVDIARCSDHLVLSYRTAAGGKTIEDFSNL